MNIIKNFNEWYIELNLDKTVPTRGNTAFGKDPKPGRTRFENKTKEYNNKNKKDYLEYVDNELKSGNVFDKNSLVSFMQNSNFVIDEQLNWVKNNRDKIDSETLKEFDSIYKKNNEIKSKNQTVSVQYFKKNYSRLYEKYQHVITTGIEENGYYNLNNIIVNTVDGKFSYNFKIQELREIQ